MISDSRSDPAAAATGPDHRPLVLALAADLLFASRIRSAAEAAGVDVILAQSPQVVPSTAVERKPRRIFLDLDTRGLDAAGLIRTLKNDPSTRAIEIIAFVAHVNESAIAAARSAGADRVLARSAFVRELPALLS